MSAGSRNVATVRIAGEEYTIRSDATPDYTQECATYVDRSVLEILRQGTLIEPHKAVILAALSLTDQLFQARSEIESLRAEVVRLAAKLSADIDSALADDLAARS